MLVQSFRAPEASVRYAGQAQGRGKRGGYRVILFCEENSRCHMDANYVSKECCQKTFRHMY